jgi:hypothetical protein
LQYNGNDDYATNRTTDRSIIVKLVRQWEGHYGAKNLIASLTFQNRTIFNENLMAIELSKKKLIFNKPMYIGMAILDIAKICVYDFHYSYIIMSPTRPPS